MSVETWVTWLPCSPWKNKPVNVTDKIRETHTVTHTWKQWLIFSLFRVVIWTPFLSFHLFCLSWCIFFFLCPFFPNISQLHIPAKVSQTFVAAFVHLYWCLVPVACLFFFAFSSYDWHGLLSLSHASQTLITDCTVLYIYGWMDCLLLNC